MRRILEEKKKGFYKTAFETLNIIGTMIQPIRWESLESAKIRKDFKGALESGLKVLEMLED